MNCGNCFFFIRNFQLSNQEVLSRIGFGDWTYHCRYNEEQSISYRITHPDSQKCDNWQSILQGKRNEKINKIL